MAGILIKLLVPKRLAFPDANYTKELFLDKLGLRSRYKGIPSSVRIFMDMYAGPEKLI